ncbi:MAG TPA: GPP34 family phosphoprotein [Streptosporangiaceae bacterium]|nr:GPP34 family phosphoprotein [Streptosporangiaceae bacterium]
MTANAADRHAPTPGLGGTGRLADDLYLMAHDERSGRQLLSARAAGLGLAGALLAELVLAGCVGIASGRVAVTGAAR